jgi:tRNA A37 threonylcarbamoyladenosine synthetase subunit TsaC/SUA5/YrdC
MAEIIKSEAPISGTGDPIPPAQITRDVGRMLKALHAGGLAVIPLDVAYGIVGCKEAAIRKLFAAKNRSYEKPSGMFSSVAISEEIHILPDAKRAIIREIIEQEKLPFSVVAPFKPDHKFFKSVAPFVLQNSTKAGTIDMLLNAGTFHNEIAHQSWEAGTPVFGSSANTSLMGSKYRLADTEPAVLDAADIAFDYGLSKYHNTEGRSSTIVDFADFSVLRVGVVFDRLKEAFKRRFDIDLKVKA